MGSSQSQSHLQKGKFAGFSERLEERRRTRDERNVPQSWIARKLAVGIVLALWGYTYYVYCIRYCLAMINGEGEWGSKAMGSAYSRCLAGWSSCSGCSRILCSVQPAVVDVWLDVHQSAPQQLSRSHSIFLIAIQVISTPPGFAKDVSVLQAPTLSRS
jgi:hypothetical protein